jgi:hypothetical protein
MRRLSSPFSHSQSANLAQTAGSPAASFECAIAYS